MIFRLALVIALAATAQAQSDPCATAPQTCATLINTQATARARIPNTVADVTVAITGSRADLAAIQKDLTARSAALLTYLRDQHAERLLTLDLTFTPDTRERKNGPEKTVGYNGTMQVSFRTTSEKSGQLLAGVLTHGANNIESTNFTPTELEVAAIRRQLAAEATQTAVAQAEVVAKAAGLHIAAIRTIEIAAPENEESYRSNTVRAMRAKVADAAVADIATAPGDNEYTLQATLQTAAVR